MTLRFQVKARTFTTAKRAHQYAKSESAKTDKRFVVLDYGMAVAAYVNGKRDTRNYDKIDAMIRAKFAPAATADMWGGA